MTMPDERHQTAAAFDDRARNYSKNAWHRLYAEALVALVPLEPGHRVLDAGVGTGFAAAAAARRIGPAGRVVGLDISRGMLRQARHAINMAGLPNVTLIQADAAAPAPFPDASFDAVVCAAALLYMPVHQALREWHRLLVTGGTVAFSTMRAGSPVAGRLFRECAAAAGVILTDPSQELGDEVRCTAALERAGFTSIAVTAGHIDMTQADLKLAWESNLKSAAHTLVLSLSAEDQEAVRASFEAAMAREQDRDASAFARAEVLYAVGTR